MERHIVDRTIARPYGEAAYRVVEALQDAGYEARWVGGAVRDMLLGRVPSDIDIATAAHPDDVLAALPGALVAAEMLGSTRVTMGGFVFEVTTYREEGAASDGRTPVQVTFGTRQQDAARRDFTVNAMYFDPIARTLEDPYGGEADLRERVVRFIGDPSTRITHDYLRVLRGVRLRAFLEGQYEPATNAALMRHGRELGVLSGARVFAELEKMLLGPAVATALEDAWEMRVLEAVLPELHACKGVGQPRQYHTEGDVWEHSKACCAAARPGDDIDVRLAALFHDCGKAVTFAVKERIRFDGHATASAELATVALQRLQCSAERVRKIDWLIRHHMMLVPLLEMPAERKAHWYYHPWFPSLLRLCYLDVAGTQPSDMSLQNALEADYNRFVDARPRPPRKLLSGDDVMRMLGMRPGAEVGAVLQALHDAQIRGDVTTKVEAEDFVRAQAQGGAGASC